MRKILSLVLFLFAIINLSQAKIIYVNPNASSGGDGASWALAYNNIGTAVSSASSTQIDTICISTSTIVLTGEIYLLAENIVFKGGYDVSSNTQTGYTTLDGNNTCRAFNLINLSSSCSIDHFIIQNGYGMSGGGMCINNSPITISDIIFKDNYASTGGALYNYLCDPVLKNLVFENNESSNGGAIYNYAANVSMTNISIISNNANYGGAISNQQNSTLQITNALIYGNSVVYNGGAIFNTSPSTQVLTNVTICNNKAALKGGAIHAADTTYLSLQNCVFYGNTAQTSNNIEGVVNLTGVSTNNAIDDISGVIGASTNLVDLSSYTPLQIFNDTSYVLGNDGLIGTIDDGFVPVSNSPLTNAGHNGCNGTPTDITGSPRVSSGTIDVGGYEYQMNTVIDKTKYNNIEVKAYSTNNNSIVVVNKSKQNGIVSVHNSIGQRIISTELKANSSETLNENLPSGIYFVNIKTVNTKKNIKIFVK